jgi:hypothetical protein
MSYTKSLAVRKTMTIIVSKTHFRFPYHNFFVWWGTSWRKTHFRFPYHNFCLFDEELAEGKHIRINYNANICHIIQHNAFQCSLNKTIHDGSKSCIANHQTVHMYKYILVEDLLHTQDFYLWVLHPVAHLSNWFLVMTSIATKFQYVNSPLFYFSFLLTICFGPYGPSSSEIYN